MLEWHGCRKGFIQGNEKEKRLPTPFRMLASITRLTTREIGGVKGTSDFTPHLYSLQAQDEEERMAACTRLVASHVRQLFGSSRNEFHEGNGSSVEDLAHCCCVAAGPCLPPPVFGVFSSVRSR